MSIERLRLDESDDKPDLSVKKESIEKIIRDDAKKDACNACGKSGNLRVCETCTYEYHLKCLLPPLKALLATWVCPKCINPLIDIDKILDCEMRPTVSKQQIIVNHYLVKWKGLSYLHCTWVPEKEFIKAYKELPSIRTHVNKFRNQMRVSEDDVFPIRPEYTMVDRVLACRQGESEEKEYFVKWVGLNYDECHWESESDISSFQQQIEKFKRLLSRYQTLKIQKSNIRDVIDSKEFQPFEKSPEFLHGGELHPYQLKGLNFLRLSWSKKTHVILADEMGLGTTTQSIAFLASLYEENLSPHLVVAPLSTLRNWEREFAILAPHMNVVMYVGSAAARALTRKHEFFFPKIHKKDKKKNSSHGIGESKQDRIKFDVLLTSYDMINMDDESLKAIYWETMIVEVNDRLKNKDLKLFSSLEQYKARHRTVLNRTTLQNNMGELFLDAAKMQTLEQELGTTHKHDAGSWITKAAPITGVDDSCGKRFPSSPGSKGNTQVIVSDDIPTEDHELVTQTHQSEDGTNHLKRKRGTPPESVVKKPIGLQEGSSGNSLTDYQQDWPFIKRSRVWATIEFYSQKPHFAPLKETKEDYREGFAIAHMVMFENLVQKLSDLKPNDPVGIISNSLKLLRDLETHGFDVSPIRRRLLKLLILKSEIRQQEATRKEVEKELEKCNHENSLVEEEMDQLKERMCVLKSKSEQIATTQKAKEEELKRLQSNDLELVFQTLAAKPM